MHKRSLLKIAALFPIACVTSTVASERDFYAGKTLTIVSPAGSGGGYDAYARLLAKYLGNYIAGRPSIIVVNRPGASGQGNRVKKSVTKD